MRRGFRRHSILDVCLTLCLKYLCMPYRMQDRAGYVIALQFLFGQLKIQMIVQFENKKLNFSLQQIDACAQYVASSAVLL